MLRPNNLYKFMEDLKIVIGKEYPRLLHIIDQRKYVEPPEIPAPHPNSLTEANDTGGKNMLEYKTRIVERIKAISQVANDKSPMFSTILRNCSAESLEMIKRTPNWNVIESGQDPLELLKRIWVTHLNPDDAIPIVSLNKLKDKYERITQSTSEPLVEYYRRHIDALRSLRAAIASMADPDILVLPSDAMQAANFITKLDSSRFAAYRSETYNACKLRGADFPDSLVKAFEEANAHVVVSTTSTVVQAGTYVTVKKEENKEKSKHKPKFKPGPSQVEKSKPPKECPLCNNGYHWKQDCPDKKLFDDALQRAREEIKSKKPDATATTRTYYTSVDEEEDYLFYSGGSHF
jgi:hypothetical protein